jgi:hypothetical protein
MMTKKSQLYQLWFENKDLKVLEAAKKIGLDKSSAFRYIRQFKKGLGPGKNTEYSGVEREGVKREFTETSGTVEVFSFHVRTLEDALEISDVDLEKWEVDRYIINSWEVTMKLNQEDGTQEPETKTNYQVKVWLKPKTPKPLEVAMERLIATIPKFKADRVPKFSAGSGNAAEIALLDAHFGKFSWGKETGRVDYDLRIATRYYLNACKQTLNFVLPHSPEKIFFIVGQDLMHTENFLGKTPLGGNTLDVDSRLPKIYYAALETVTRCIYLARDVAPVSVLWIPGNHDMHSSFYLCSALKEHFRQDKHVEIDNSPSWRKRVLWGNLLVGWTHEIVSRHNAWANELAQAWPEDWGKSKFREWHFGHKHRKSETKTHPVMTQGGVIMRQLTALSPIDAWHYQNLFTDAVPGGESFLWTKDQGIVANFTAWVKEE